MDVKVYKKEEVLQPSGIENVYVPDVIDIIPNIVETETCEKLVSAEILDTDSKELQEQECALATIWQRGLDPLAPTEGVRWSQAMLEEINSLQLMQDIIESVAKVTTSVRVVFDTIEDDKGNTFLTYKLLEVL